MNGDLGCRTRGRNRAHFSISMAFSSIIVPSATYARVAVAHSCSGTANMSRRLSVLVSNEDGSLFIKSGRRGLGRRRVFVESCVLPVRVTGFFFFSTRGVIDFTRVGAPRRQRRLDHTCSRILNVRGCSSLGGRLRHVRSSCHGSSTGPRSEMTFGGLLSSVGGSRGRVQSVSRYVSEGNRSVVVTRRSSGRLRRGLIQRKSLVSLSGLGRLHRGTRKLEATLRSCRVRLGSLCGLVPFTLTKGLISRIGRRLRRRTTCGGGGLRRTSIGSRARGVLGSLRRTGGSFGRRVSVEVHSFCRGRVEALMGGCFCRSISLGHFRRFSLLRSFSRVRVGSFGSLIFGVGGDGDLFSGLGGRCSGTGIRLFSVRGGVERTRGRTRGSCIRRLEHGGRHVSRHVVRLVGSGTSGQSHGRLLFSRVITGGGRGSDLSGGVRITGGGGGISAITNGLVCGVRGFLVDFGRRGGGTLRRGLVRGLQLCLRGSGLIGGIVISVAKGKSSISVGLCSFSGHGVSGNGLSVNRHRVFTSTLLKTLMRRARVSFPIFVSDPVRGFSTDRAQGILAGFCPGISGRIILFPLLVGRVARGRCRVVSPLIKGTCLVRGSSGNSSFARIRTRGLFSGCGRLGLY